MAFGILHKMVNRLGTDRKVYVYAEKRGYESYYILYQIGEYINAISCNGSDVTRITFQKAALGTDRYLMGRISEKRADDITNHCRLVAWYDGSTHTYYSKYSDLL